MTLSQHEFRDLYSRLAPALRARCRAITGNDADADDALQETFLRAWRARSRFDGRHPYGWLGTIAKNTSLDVVRRRRPTDSDPVVLGRLVAERGHGGAGVDVQRALGTMSDADAQLLRRRHGHDWRIQELASDLGTSQRTVRRKLERLEKRARAVLGVALATAAALVLTFFGIRTERPTTEPAYRGALDLQMVRVRGDDASFVADVVSGWPGDRVQYGVTVPADGFVTVFDVQADGVVAIWLVTPVLAYEQVVGAAILDDYPDDERLFVLFADQPVAVDTFTDALDIVWGPALADLDRVPLPGVVQRSVLIVKETP